MKRVVVTGIGAVTPLGNTFYESWAALKQGMSGIGQITRFHTSESRWKIAGEIKGFSAGTYLSRKEALRLDLFVHYAVAASLMAVQDAGLLSSTTSAFRQRLYLDKGGVIIGSSRGGITTLENAISTLYLKSHGSGERSSSTKRLVSAYLMPATTISMASTFVAQKLGIRGYCSGISSACASGTCAIGEGFRLIKSGYKGPVICGGTEAPLCRICIEGYGVSGALSCVNDTTASRPFDLKRDGFVLSEGACILVLEEEALAMKRGAKIYGEIIGFGSTTDAFDQTIPKAEGEAEAIRNAMKVSRIKPEEIDFISAHGTSTPRGDKTETKAIKMFFKKHAYCIPITSIKSMTGHMLAASGSLEAACTLLSMKEGVITPTINLTERDPECDLDYVTAQRKAEIRSALSLSFGFGGLNAVLVFKKFNA